MLLLRGATKNPNLTAKNSMSVKEDSLSFFQPFSLPSKLDDDEEERTRPFTLSWMKEERAKKKEERRRGGGN